MIINEQKSNIQVIGDITEFKSSIDPKNLEFITTLLSSNLYSAPERSFIREIVSNAWDSQVEAGTTDIPIIIKITEKKEGLYYPSFTGKGDITIRDFGIGLSPERFNLIYRNIGSSTKRESNDYHGAFGIGHLSGFSCSNTMYITSYYNGTCYEYIGIKDANTIVYTLVSTTPTSEKNGLEVTLKNVFLSKYRKSLKYISFFPNVFIEDNNSYEDININKIRIKKYNNFWVSAAVARDKILLGNVLYPLNTNELNLRSYTNNLLSDFLNNIQNTGIVLKFDIGELSVTPNRENIIYTKESISKIINKIEAAKKEIEDIINGKLKKDFTDLLKYVQYINSKNSFDFFTEDICEYSIYLYSIKNNNTNYTYKGKNLLDYYDLLHLVYNIQFLSKYIIVNEYVYTVNSKLPYRYKQYFNLSDYSNKNCKILILKEDIKLSKYSRSYIIETYGSTCIIIKPLDLKSIKQYISLNYLNYTDIDFILQEIIDYIYNIGTVIDFDNNADFIKYKEKCKKEAKLNREKDTFKNKKVVVRIYKDGYYASTNHTFDNFDKAVEYLKSLHKGIVFIDRDTSASIKDLIIKRGFAPVLVNKKVKEAFKEYSFNVDLNWVLIRDPYLNYYKTIIETFNEEYKVVKNLKRLKEIISSNYLEDIDNIIKVFTSYVSNPAYGVYAKRVGIIDKSLENRLLKIKGFLEEYNKAVDIIKDSGLNLDVYYSYTTRKYKAIIAKILVKNKSFIVNPDVYKDIKHNKLIQILCKK